MGFKSVMKKVGKVALKVAPYAALAIPGVGPLAMAGIQAGIGAANAKASGAGLKGVLAGAGMGAATSALPVKGLGPSASVAKGAASTAVKSAAKTGVKSVLSNVAKQTGKQVLGQALSGNIGQFVPSPSQNSYTPDRTPPDTGRNVVSREYGNAPGFSYGPNNPNLGDAILAGRKNAIRDQGFRSGYNILGQAPEPTDEVPNPERPILSKIPRISNPLRGSGRRQQSATY